MQTSHRELCPFLGYSWTLALFWERRELDGFWGTRGASSLDQERNQPQGCLDGAWRWAGGCAGTWRKGCWKLCSWLPPQPSALKLSAHLQQRDGRSEWRRDGFSTWLDSHPAPIDAPFQRSPLHGGGLKIAFHHLTNTESHYLCFCNLLKSDINIILVLFIRSALHLYSSK